MSKWKTGRIRARRLLIKLGMQVGFAPGHVVLDGDPPPPKGHNPQFLAHICYGQMAGWIKMPLRMEVGLGPGDFRQMGTQLPLPKRGRSLPPQFSAHVHCGQLL